MKSTMINLAIVKTELIRLFRINMIWAVIWGLLAAMLMSFFDLINSTEGVANVYEAFPEEFLDLFGAEAELLGSVEGYFSLEIFLLYGLAAAIFGAYLGGNSLGKEVTARTFHFLLANPVSRIGIYLSKTLVMVIYAAITNMMIAVFSFMSSEALATSDDAEFSYFVLLFVMGAILQLLFMAFGQLVSIVTDEGKALLSAAGIAIFGLVIDQITNLDNIPEWLKFVTPYYYLDTAHLVETGELLAPDIWVPVIAIPVFIVVGIWYFRKKDIHI